jgi:putative intracellular protease/amidase
MKRFLIIVTILLSMAVCGALAHAESGSKVLLMPREGISNDIDLMLTKEVGVMTSMLKKAGFEVVVVTVSGKPIVAPTTTLEPDLKLADVKVADYVSFIMPCMAVGLWPGPPVAPEAVAIVKQAVAEGKPVAAQLGSVIILAEAGVLKGKQYAFYTDPLSRDARFEGAIYSNDTIVKDGNIITSCCCPKMATWGYPDGTANLTQTLIVKLKKK